MWEDARETLAEAGTYMTIREIWDRIEPSWRSSGIGTLHTVLRRKAKGRTEAWTNTSRIFHELLGNPTRFGLLKWSDTISQTLSKISEDEIDPYFDPKNDKDARERIATSIARRRGQPKFRKDLLNAYEGKCAITGCRVEAILEAAHITPYKGDHTNKPANGLLLRADIHSLFDLGLIAVDTMTMTVIIAPTLANTEYERLKGSRLIAKPQTVQRIKAALDEHRYKYFGN